MRITIILGPFLPIPPILGGAVEKVHLTLAASYQEAGHTVTIVSRRYQSLPTEEVIDGVRHLRVQSHNRSRHLGLQLFLSLCYSIRAAIAMPPSDITVSNEVFAPLILSRRKAGKIYVQVGRFPKYQMFLYFRADRLQAVSRAIGSAIRRQAPWLATKVRVIGYAIGDSYFRPAAAVRRRTILFVGRIAREKGVELLIRALVILKQRGGVRAPEGWTLRLIGPWQIVQGGDGAAYLCRLQQLAEPLGNACQFVGPIFDEESLIREYQSASIFVYPSLAEFGESFGLAPLEAMACGCATIVSDLRCFDDFLDAPTTGLKFDHRAPAAAANLAGELEKLLSDPALLGRIASAGRQVASRFRTEPIAQRMLEDFSELLQPGTASAA